MAVLESKHQPICPKRRFRKTVHKTVPDIGLASYSIIPLRCTRLCLFGRDCKYEDTEKQFNKQNYMKFLILPIDVSDWRLCFFCLLSSKAEDVTAEGEGLSNSRCSK